ncbi:BgTH12-07130 [Blumeria graminis f. sp. triticale]|uniref:BgTH12-07130 n=1 Tax=Blumeria graminis f. sp. triticale TaxID=1689686 RepID=A0A9W4D8Q7_BLUGR|nr:BgTH12-07130 [Blumeria graminis f. sp. triticale]
MSLTDLFHNLDVLTSPQRYPNICAHHNGPCLSRSSSSGNKLLKLKATKIGPHLFHRVDINGSNCGTASQNKCATAKHEPCLPSQLKAVQTICGLQKEGYI